jgi:Leucine-rich repeat (LRR) protein
VFPSLEMFNAGSCAIVEISYTNFKDLTTLRELRLHDNQIETIKSGTFMDLNSLETLRLGKIIIN